MKKWLFILLSMAVLASCTQSSSKNESKDGPIDSLQIPKGDSAVRKESVVLDVNSLNLDSEKVKELNNLAKFISGMNVGEESRLSKYTKTKTWKSYAQQANVTWSNFFNKNEAARTWGNNNLSESRKNGTKLIYPFSGPDVLFPEIFFPQTKEVFMIGLEPVGSVPIFKDIDEKELDTIFEKYKRAINEVIKFSFFMTKKMKVELTNEDIDGTTPIIMLFLVREGKELLKVEPIVIGSEGEVVVKNSFKEIKNANNKGVRFFYNNKGSNEVRQITYISTNLADGTLSVNKGLLAFFEKMQGTICSYVKSASYLMHKEAFSTIRNTLLAKSNFHLQDDSGIPYKHFDKKAWDVKLFGTYEKPIKLFEACHEGDLAAAFKDSTIKRLNFRIGYASKSNLLFAKKR